ncbi:hypothetical protein MY4824_006772 [Beauveria thailandica]
MAELRELDYVLQMAALLHDPETKFDLQEGPRQALLSSPTPDKFRAKSPHRQPLNVDDACAWSASGNGLFEADYCDFS